MQRLPGHQAVLRACTGAPLAGPLRPFSMQEHVMDRRLLMLALGMFALGTDSFVIAGVLPEISRNFHVSIGAAGQLTTVYAIAYALLMMWNGPASGDRKMLGCLRTTSRGVVP